MLYDIIRGGVEQQVAVEPCYEWEYFALNTGVRNISNHEKHKEGGSHIIVNTSGFL